MPLMAEKTASAVWNGTLAEGSGSVSTASGVLENAGLTWRVRTTDTDEATSPEELVAAAHAACYAMAFSYALGNAGTPPEKLEVTATVGFGPNPGGGMKVTHSKLHVKGTVAGYDQAGFAKAAVEAEKGCPISNALRNNIEISVEAELA
jgi:osmotically inducible protein OsmC